MIILSYIIVVQISVIFLLYISSAKTWDIWGQFDQCFIV